MVAPQQLRVGAVKVWSRDDHVHAVLGQPSPGTSLWNLLSPTTVHFGIRWVAQPQLDTRSDLIPQGRPDLSPARGSHHGMYAVRKSLGSKRCQPGFRCLELAVQAEPTVDDEKDV